MFRWMIPFALLTTTTAFGQGLFKDGPAKKGDEPTRTVVRFDVKAMPAPRPALKYQLLPELSEIQPGTALQLYLKCFMEQHHFYHSREANDEREKWLTMPLKDLPVKKVLQNYGGRSLRYADDAARTERIEWQVLRYLRDEGMFALLPDVQKLRELARALRVRLRGEVADRRFDDAIGTTKTLYKLSHQFGDHPTLIGNLVGLAIGHLNTQSVEEMLQQPGCPNLYWAFTGMPSPLVSLRSGMQGERLWFQKDFALVDPVEPMSEAKLEKAMATYQRWFVGWDGSGKTDMDVRAFVRERAGDAKHVAAARARLAEAGLKADDLKKMPAVQVVLLDEQQMLRERGDDVAKWLTQPFWKAEPNLLVVPKRTPALFDRMLPNALRMHRAQVRVEQRLRMLQVLEAIRLHAAAKKGAVPAKLEEIDVTVPIDPVSGKPFRYAVEGGKAVLTGTPPRGEEKTAAYNVVYEITIVK